MKKFGGPAKKKKACKHRVCTGTLQNKEVNSGITQPDVADTISRLSHAVDSFRKFFTDYHSYYTSSNNI